MEEKLKKLTLEFLENLSILASDVKVVKDTDGYYHIDVSTDETGLLIGFHGETIQSLELLIKIAIYNSEKENVKLILNVGDYREQKEERLKFLADRMIEKLKERGGDVAFSYLSPSERRVIHVYLKDNPEVEAVSEGEGANRRLVLRMKQEQSI